MDAHPPSAGIMLAFPARYDAISDPGRIACIDSYAVEPVDAPQLSEASA
jgi:hypothetical protein